MNNKKLGLRQRLSSIGLAIQGLIQFWRKEPNAKIHFAAAFASAILGFYYSISRLEWIAVIVCLASVIAMELLNTAIEELCNHLHPDRHERIKFVKDISAAAVFIFAIGALLVGFIIFYPKMTQ